MSNKSNRRLGYLILRLLFYKLRNSKFSLFLFASNLEASTDTCSKSNWSFCRFYPITTTEDILYSSIHLFIYKISEGMVTRRFIIQQVHVRILTLQRFSSSLKLAYVVSIKPNKIVLGMAAI